MPRWISALARSRRPAPLALLALSFLIVSAAAAEDHPVFVEGAPLPQSMSSLAFHPDGVLFVGDSRAGQIIAYDLRDRQVREAKDPVTVPNLEAVIAARLGTMPAKVLIHDLAVHPKSQEIFLAVSLGREAQTTGWTLPNDAGDARLLLRVDPAGAVDEVRLDELASARMALPNPPDPAKPHRWKEGITLRVDTVTDLAFHKGSLFVSGLSNEEFASTLWRLPYPFAEGATATTLEIFHGAHGRYETHAPIRTFVPYQIDGEDYLLAAYLCTPLVVFRVDDLRDGAHVRGRTVAEFGSGNYPLDMVPVRLGFHPRIVLANSNLPFLVFDPADVGSFQGSIDTEVQGYTAGVHAEYRSGVGITQLAALNDEQLVGLQRLPSGQLDLVSFRAARF